MIVDTTHGSVTTLVDANSRDIITNPMSVEESVLIYQSAMSFKKDHSSMVDVYRNQGLFNKLRVYFAR